MSVLVELSFDQLKEALHKLPSEEKVAIWRMLDAEIDRPAIAQHFDAAIKEIRSSYSNISEDEVMADAVAATHLARKAKHAKNRA